MAMVSGEKPENVVVTALFPYDLSVSASAACGVHQSGRLGSQGRLLRLTS
jgi:hypothetical protein